jgi:hypothetical protein
MVRKSINLRALLPPIIGVVILEILWNFLEGFINPSILNIPLHIIKYILYAIAGYIAALLGSETIDGAIYGGITGGIGAIIEGFIISMLFYGVFFYTPGFPIIYALRHIISLIITGAIFGYIGAILRSVPALSFLEEILKPFIESE